MILTPNEHFTIILSAIRDYQPGETDIPILLCEKISNQLSESIDSQIDTQDIYDEVEFCFNLYNDFIKERDIDLQLIDEGFYQLVMVYLNMINKEMESDNNV